MLLLAFSFTGFEWPDKQQAYMNGPAVSDALEEQGEKQHTGAEYF